MNNQQYSTAEDRVVKELEQESAEQNGFFKNLTTQYVIIIAVVALVVTFYIFGMETLWPYAVVVGLIWLFLSQKKEPMDDFIPMREAKAIVYNEIKWEMYNTPHYPNGTLRIIGPCALRIFDDEPKYWEIAFEISDEFYLKHKYSAMVHAYNAKIMRVMTRAEGFTGKEAPEVRTRYPAGLRDEAEIRRVLSGKVNPNAPISRGDSYYE